MPPPQNQTRTPATSCRSNTDLIFRATETRGAAKHALPDHADIWCELAADLVAQAQAQAGVGQARAQSPGRIGFAVKIGLELRLQDQTLGDQQLVLGLEARRRAAASTDIAGGLDVEPVGRQTLYAESRPVAARPVAEVVAHAQRAVPERGDGMAPQRFDVPLLHMPGTARALAAQQQTVAVAAVPGLCIPGLAADAVGAGRFELVDQHLAEPLVIGHVHAGHGHGFELRQIGRGIGRTGWQRGRRRRRGGGCGRRMVLTVRCFHPWHA